MLHVLHPALHPSASLSNTTEAFLTTFYLGDRDPNFAFVKLGALTTLSGLFQQNLL